MDLQHSEVKAAKLQTDYKIGKKDFMTCRQHGFESQYDLLKKKWKEESKKEGKGEEITKASAYSYKKDDTTVNWIHSCTC